MTQIHDLTALEQAAAIRRREVSPVDIVDHYLDRIERLNPQVGAYVTVTAERARDDARKAERAVLEAAEPTSLPPLLGVPVPVKDLNMVKSVRTTFGSAAFDDFVGVADDQVVTFLHDAGSILLGKTNTPEFGLPCYTENDVAPAARTPWDLSRSAGGSSGGAAAAVAAGLAPVAHGSDGGGSIRIPASVCGLFGLKPSRGRVTRGPITPDGFGLATDGSLARSVRDAALLLDVIARPVPGDIFMAPPLPEGMTFSRYADREPGRLRIGRSIEPVIADAEVHPDCVAAYEATSELLAELGHEVVDMPAAFGANVVPHFEALWATMATLMPVPPDRVDRLQPLTRWLRDRGDEVSGTRLLQAHAQLQHALRSGMATMAEYDAVLHPTLAQPPAPVGYFHDEEPAESFERQKRFTPFTAIYNMSGQPAVNVPLHWTADGLPIGVMFAGRLGDEGPLISLAAQLEAARPWRHRHPTLW